MGRLVVLERLAANARKEDNDVPLDMDWGVVQAESNLVMAGDCGHCGGGDFVISVACCVYGHGNRQSCVGRSAACDRMAEFDDKEVNGLNTCCSYMCCPYVQVIVLAVALTTVVTWSALVLKLRGIRHTKVVTVGVDKMSPVRPAGFLPG